jgi:hypothetical protein
MVKLDWTSRDDRIFGRGNMKAVETPYLQQGVRDALCNAYRRADDNLPPELDILLRKLT